MLIGSECQSGHVPGVAIGPSAASRRTASRPTRKSKKTLGRDDGTPSANSCHTDHENALRAGFQARLRRNPRPRVHPVQTANAGLAILHKRVIARRPLERPTTNGLGVNWRSLLLKGRM